MYFRCVALLRHNNPNINIFYTSGIGYVGHIHVVHVYSCNPFQHHMHPIKQNKLLWVSTRFLFYSISKWKQKASKLWAKIHKVTINIICSHLHCCNYYCYYLALVCHRNINSNMRWNAKTNFLWKKALNLWSNKKRWYKLCINVQQCSLEQWHYLKSTAYTNTA